MANVTASMENVAKTTLWQSNESSYLNAFRPSVTESEAKSIHVKKLTEQDSPPVGNRKKRTARTITCHRWGMGTPSCPVLSWMGYLFCPDWRGGPHPDLSWPEGVPHPVLEGGEVPHPDLSWP